MRIPTLVILSTVLASGVLGADLRWHEDYGKAYQEAKEKKKLLLISFFEDGQEYHPQAQVVDDLKDSVLLRVPVSVTVPDGEKQKPLQSYAGFGSLDNGPGLAMINLKYEGKAFGGVVGTLRLADANASVTRVVQFLEEPARACGPGELADRFGLIWHTEYAKAAAQAKKEKKLLLVAFDSKDVRFSPDAAVAKQLKDFVLARLRVADSGSLLSHEGFRYLHRACGICVVDFKHEDESHGRAVHVLPAEYLTVPGTKALLDLADRRSSGPELRWLTDYHQAKAIASEQKKMLLIAVDSGEEVFVPKPMSIPALHGYVLLRQTTENRYRWNGEEKGLLEYTDFQPLRGQAGLVIYDFKHEDKPYHGKVVSVMPYRYLGPNPGNRVFGEEERQCQFVILEPNTLSQRTLTWAIRVSKAYGENQHLRSADGRPDDTLMYWALRNSQLQCSYGCGHHAGGPMRSEIASPGPGSDIVDGALNMVRIWRSSPPHYSSMVRYHRRFGYDMSPSSRKHWYGTGRF